MQNGLRKLEHSHVGWEKAHGGEERKCSQQANAGQVESKVQPFPSGPVALVALPTAHRDPEESGDPMGH